MPTEGFCSNCCTRRQALGALGLLAGLAVIPARAQGKAPSGGILAQLDAATWIAEGQGRRILYVFFDPNCPYCHMLFGRLRAFVGKQGLEVRWVPLGILTRSSLPKAAAILQAASPLQAFYKNEDDYDFAANGQPGGGIEPAASISSKARDALARNLAIYRDHRLFGVPVLIWKGADGEVSTLPGVPSDAELASIIASIR